MNVSKKLSTLAVALLSMGLNKAAEATQDLDKFPVCKGYSKDKDLYYFSYAIRNQGIQKNHHLVST